MADVPVPPGTTGLSAPTQERIARHLKPGEAVVWVGHPNAVAFGRKWMGVVPVGIVFIGLSTFAMFNYEGPPAGEPAAWLAPYLLKGFLVAGCVLVYLPWVFRLLARKYDYVLTTHRALVLRGWPLSIFTADKYYPAEWKELCSRENNDGTGDVIFRKVFHTEEDGRQTVSEHGFLAVSHVRELEALIRQTWEENTGFRPFTAMADTLPQTNADR
jgi:hypothetical protein